MKTSVALEQDGVQLNARPKKHYRTHMPRIGGFRYVFSVGF